MTVYGLDITPVLKPEDKRDAFDKALTGHVVAKGQLLGAFLH